jgi:hypothetical protein
VQKEMMSLLSECQTRFHLQLLFPDEPFTFQLKLAQKGYTISLSKEECKLVDLPEEDVDFVISGEKRALLKLFYGEGRLTNLVNDHEVTVMGAYRHLLFTESVLWLCRSMEAESMIV